MYYVLVRVHRATKECYYVTTLTDIYLYTPLLCSHLVKFFTYLVLQPQLTSESVGANSECYELPGSYLLDREASLGRPQPMRPERVPAPHFLPPTYP